MEILTDGDPWTGGILTGVTVSMKLMPAAADEGVLEGYGATFGGRDAHGDTIRPGAFAQSLAGHVSAGSSPPMLWQHRQAEPIGKWLGMGEDARGLRVRGQLNLQSSRGREAHAHLKAGDLDGLSIGFTIPPGGQQHEEKGRTLSKIDLHELSVVSVPSDTGARLTSVKSIELKSLGDLRALLRDAGLPRAAAEKLAPGGWPALSGEPETPPPDPAALKLIEALDRSALDLKALKDLFR